MKTKIIPVKDAVPGMIVAHDIYTFNNVLLIDRGSALSDRVITRLMFYNVESVEILLKEDSVEKEIEKTTSLFVPKITAEEAAIIKEYEQSTAKIVTSFKRTLNDMFVNKEKIDTNVLISDLNHLMGKTRNSFHLLNLLHTLNDKDDVIFLHSVNVALVANIIAKILDFDANDTEILILCGLLHDIGKLAIPSKILKNTATLTDAEFTIIKTHPSKGYELLNEIDLDVRIKNTCLMHHERCDGSGYPNNITSDTIEPFAKIIAIADCYEAMTAPRPYRDALCPFEVIEFFENDGYRKFDPQYLVPFLDCIVDSYINKYVILSNGQKGTIVFINKMSLSKPIVKLEDGQFIDLYSQKNISIKKILD